MILKYKEDDNLEANVLFQKFIFYTKISFLNKRLLKKFSLKYLFLKLFVLSISKFIFSIKLTIQDYTYGKFHCIKLL